MRVENEFIFIMFFIPVACEMVSPSKEMSFFRALKPRVQAQEISQHRRARSSAAHDEDRTIGSRDALVHTPSLGNGVRPLDFNKG